MHTFNISIFRETSIQATTHCEWSIRISLHVLLLNAKMFITFRPNHAFLCSAEGYVHSGISLEYKHQSLEQRVRELSENVP